MDENAVLLGLGAVALLCVALWRSMRPERGTSVTLRSGPVAVPVEPVVVGGKEEAVREAGDRTSTELQAWLVTDGGRIPLHSGDEEAFWTIVDAVCAVTGTSWEKLPDAEHDQR